MLTEKIHNELKITIAHVRGGNIEITLDDAESVTEIKASPTELRRICLMILAECDKVDFCRYLPTVGHA
jgi:hypothetical protein